MADFAGEGDLDSVAGRSDDPPKPFQIMARAPFAHPNRDWDKEAILSRSCTIAALSVPFFDSSFILLTSCETCTDSISGKLCCGNESDSTRGGMTYEREKLENTSSTILERGEFL